MYLLPLYTICKEDEKLLTVHTYLSVYTVLYSKTSE